MNDLVKYYPSHGVRAMFNSDEMDKMIEMGMEKFRTRDVTISEESMYCCRLLSDETMVVMVIMLNEHKEQMVSLLLWKEAEEAGISEHIKKIVGK